MRATGRQRALLVVENVSLARDHRLRKQAQSLVAAGYGVSVVCRSDPANPRLDGVTLHQYPAPPDAESKLGFLREYGFSWVMAAFLVVKSFMRDGFDVIQISGTPDIYFTIAAPFKLLGRRVVLDQRDLSPELYEARYGRQDAVYRILLRLEKISYRTADHVLTVNESLRRVAYERGGLPRGSVTIVGNGPVLARTYKRAPRPELRHGRRYLCCWLGVMGPQDSLDVALRAIAHLVHTIGRTDCHFALIGGGEVLEQSRQLAGELGLRDWVSFPGWVEEEEVFSYLSTAELGLEPNQEKIVSPVKGMEYMAFSLPFVAFDLAETKALAGAAAAYAPVADVERLAGLVDELLDDPQRRRTMGDLGRRTVEQSVAWDHQQTRYVDVFRRLLGQRASSEALTKEAQAG